MAERTAYSPITTINDRSRRQMMEFYGTKPLESTNLFALEQRLPLVVEELQNFSWAYLTPIGSELIAKLYQLLSTTQYLGEAETEYNAAVELRQRFGLPMEEIYDLALPVYLELARDELSSQETVKKIAQETDSLMDDVSRLSLLLIHSLAQEEERINTEEKLWQKTKDQVDDLDSEGHLEIAREKEIGSRRLQARIDSSKKSSTAFEKGAARFEKGKDTVALPITVFSQRATQSIELREIRSQAA